MDYEGDYLAHGDMPHNWASVDFVRLIRNSLALERGRELHLFEGLPNHWLKPGMKTSFNQVSTTFGELSFELAVSKEGGKATLDLMLDPYDGQTPEKIVVHQGAFNEEEHALSLDWEERVKVDIDLK